MTRPIDFDARVRDLNWADVDPARWPFDARDAQRLAVEALMDTGRDGEWRTQAEDEINRRFVRAYGPWACGWRFARDEGTIGGGVVGAWCCPQHSVMPNDDDPEPTARRAAAALVEWRAWLSALQQLFDELGAATELASSVGSAAARIVEVVVEQTHAGDAWYVHCAQVLAWYLERWGADTERAHAVVQKAIGGRFKSWTAPPTDVRESVAHDLDAPGAGVLLGMGPARRGDA